MFARRARSFPTLFACFLLRVFASRADWKVCVVVSPSDSPGPTEAHREDICVMGGGYAGKLNDAGSIAQPYACEIDLVCPSGWTLYVDNGSEGKNSCLMASSGTFASWSAATSACPSNSHLVSIGASVFSSGLPAALTSIATDSPWYGCSQASTATQRGAGWTWVDGTSALNINCGSGAGGEGCGVWAVGEPK